MITSQQLKKKYLEFFKKKGHAIIPSASLIPENDPTVLFTTAGMHPLVPYLLWEKHPAGKRLVNVQKCIRTGDIEEVGDSWHLTFFEMLGNWSLGDYFKKEAIAWSWEFLTSKKWLGLDPNRISVSVFAGDKDAPFDQEAHQTWLEVGLPQERIYKYGKAENWWGPAGKTGPCGPDTEMYYDSGRPECPNCQTRGPACECGKYAEIWNDVFMQYNKTAAGKYEPLKQRNVDTGMGVERTVAVLNGHDNAYEADTLKPIINFIKTLSKDTPSYPGDKAFDSLYQPGVELAKLMEQNAELAKLLRSSRIIADHLRAATFILGDEKGIIPSNLEQGYVLRRLIRRAVRYGKMIGIKKPFTFQVAEIVIKLMADDYPALKKNKEFIIEQLVQEEEKFSKTLERGLRELNKLFPIGEIERIKNGKLPILNRVDAKKAFYIFQTYGFPLEMIQEELARRALVVDEDEFEKEFAQHQELSRTATEGRFKGGLADHSEQTKKLHTATHLLLAALRQILGDHVFQKGSNITAERLRLDFSHPEKLTDEQLKQVEDLVNQKIKEKLPVTYEEVTLEEAKKQGAIGVFEHKYGDKVKVYSISDFSQEICGGPHVKNTGELGKFKIKKEEASSAGVRRIKAVLE